MNTIPLLERPIAIALAPDRVPSSTMGGGQSAVRSGSMSFACQTCTRRKVKCDKLMPICSTCLKAKLECSYQAPPPRKRKRKTSGDLHERLIRYERILEKHGLLTEDTNNEILLEVTKPQEPANSSTWNKPGRVGKLLSGEGSTRYIDSSLWHNLGEEEMTRIVDDQDSDDNERFTSVTPNDFVLAGDPLSGAFLGTPRSLLEYHPSTSQAKMLWQAHIENVEPICKVLHVPSITSMVKTASAHPYYASKADECILFAIYHFAIVSSSDEFCQQNFGQPRESLRIRYHNALRQALINASFLKTTQIPVLQAFILYLLSTRHQNDPQTLWMLTGAAIRIAQRMGIHKDGESLGLPPFDVQLRRRLFYQLIPLDGYAGQLSGTGISIDPGYWDSKRPLNLNDDQIWPGMTHQPDEQIGASEMIFCLARAEMGALYMKATDDFFGKPPLYKSHSWHGCDGATLDTVDQMEATIETKYVRYCDILNPLHILLLGMVRSAANAARLRMKLPSLRSDTASIEERRDVCTIAGKIIDTDSAAYANPSLNRFMWHIKAFFQWDALICMLISMTKRDLLIPTKLDEAWRRIEQVFSNHAEILQPNRMLNTAVGRITLKAWDANPPSFAVTDEPHYINALRTLHAQGEEKRRRQTGRSTVGTGSAENAMLVNPSPSSDLKALDQSADGMDFGFDNDFTFYSADYLF